MSAPEEVPTTSTGVRGAELAARLERLERADRP